MLSESGSNLNSWPVLDVAPHRLCVSDGKNDLKQNHSGFLFSSEVCLGIRGVLGGRINSRSQAAEAASLIMFVLRGAP